MKRLLYIFLTIALLTCAGCKKSSNPVDDLPPETQTGANTFGCLVNGQAFVPNGSPFAGPKLKAQFQYISGGFSFLVSGDNKDFSASVSIIADSVSMLKAGAYELGDYKIMGQYGGRYYVVKSTLIAEYRTKSISAGSLVIKKFDYNNQIVSGTFWFNASDDNGNPVEIREGRFDVKFVK